MSFWINDWRGVAILCIGLGLAPFWPEPHLVGKIRWLAGGAVGMTALDWFDLFWHAWPFGLAIRLAGRFLIAKGRSGS